MLAGSRRAVLCPALPKGTFSTVSAPNRAFRPKHVAGVHRTASLSVHRRGPVSYTHLTLPTICSV
eukprot:4989592-Alexandrium_andersonii.AAC.1